MASQQADGSIKSDIDYISDESSFYGDDDLKASLESQSAAFNPSTYWSTHDLRLSTRAYKIATTMAHASPPPALKPIYNMYESYPSGRHLSETVPEFLTRLPPYSTSISTSGPWIYIANPSYQDQPTREDMAGFKLAGQKLLEDFTTAKANIETSMAGKAKGTITKKITPLRKKLETDIYRLAQEKGVRSGKWMFFPPAEDVNALWGVVANAVAEGELGHAAKVATDDGTGNRGARLICVYNENFEDNDDVKRVLEKLVGLGLVKNGGEGRGIYYKTDAYSHLDIMGGNEWGLKPSLYSSLNML